MISVSADVPPKSGLYVHPEGPFTGSQLNQVPISFEKMKLSNSSSGPDGKILMLASMMKYKPRIYLIQGKVTIDPDVEKRPTVILVNDSNVRKMVNHKMFEFEELEFIAVTAYQVKIWCRANCIWIRKIIGIFRIK